MKKKLLSILVCVMVILNSGAITYVAASERIQVTPDFSEEDYLESRIDNTVLEWSNPTPFYNHVATVLVGFGIYGNEAECTLTVDGYSEVTKISAYIYIQRYNLGKWTTITGGSFRKDVKANSLYFSPTKALDTIGTYRISAQVFVYTKDGSVELIEEVSNTEVY